MSRRGRHGGRGGMFRRSPKRKPVPGPRKTALAERRKRNRKRMLSTLLALIVLAPAAVWATLALTGNDSVGRGDDGGPAAPRSDTMRTMLVAGAGAGGGPAEWLTLFFTDVERDRAVVVYIPSHTAVEIPGRGLQGIGAALSSDDDELLVLSTSSLLGLEIDHYAGFSSEEAGILLGLVAPLTVDVPVEVREEVGPGTERVRFPIGSQELDAEDLTDLLFERGIAGDDVSLGSRHLAFWSALFNDHRGEPSDLAERLVPGFEAAGHTPAEAEMAASLAAFPAAQTTLTILPVRQVGVGGDELYSADTAEIARFVEDTFGEGVGMAAGTRVRILNGNGRPGIGQEVGELLLGEGFRIVLTGNAPRLDYEETLIVIHDDGAADAAERARELLGVGEVQVSAQEQGIVDLTIVVGRDFLQRGNRSQ